MTNELKSHDDHVTTDQSESATGSSNDVVGSGQKSNFDAPEVDQALRVNHERQLHDKIEISKLTPTIPESSVFSLVQVMTHYMSHPINH